MSNGYKATVMLAAVTGTFLLSYPFSQNFWGGLIASGSSAAMVGGLADWFAVSALFRRPLGIPFRTEIIPRNRQRFEQAIIDMMEEELFTTENIRELLKKYDIVDLLIRYLEQYGGKEEIKEFGQKLSDEVITQVNVEQAANVLADLTRKYGSRVSLAEPLSSMLKWSIDNGYFDKIVNFIILELIRLAHEPEFVNLFGAMFEEARKVYERNMQRRQFAGKILEGMGLTQEILGKFLAEKMETFLKAMLSAQHPVRILLREQAVKLAGCLVTEPALADKVERWKKKALSALGIQPRFYQFMSLFQAELMAGGAREFMQNRIGYEVERLIGYFHYRKETKDYVGGLLNKGILELIEVKHNKIGAIVRERLEQFSTAELVDFIESRVGNELDIIRINGSVVGGLAGMLIYLAGYWW